MTDATAPGTIKRILKSSERTALCDIGYNVKGIYTYGIGTSFQSAFNLGTDCSGISVAGINDGMNQVNGMYTITGDADNGPTINHVSIANILANDKNAVEFEGLEDVFSTSTVLSTTFGNVSTVIDFHSPDGGLHLLRYVPKSADGQKWEYHLYLCISLWI